MTNRIDLVELSQRENGQTEWKEDVADTDNVVKTLTAFANDYQNLGGGYVVCGAKEDKDQHGFPTLVRVGMTSARIKEVEGRVLDACLKRVSPSISPHVEELPSDDENRRILVFIQPATATTHTFRNNEGTNYYFRNGQATKEARNGVLKDLLVRKGSLEPWDRRPCNNATVEDLDLLVLRDSLQGMGLVSSQENIENYLSTVVQIHALLPPLLVQEPLTGILRPRNFAILLFGRNTQHFIPGAYNFLSIYPGTDRSGRHAERHEITGSIIAQERRIRELFNAQSYTTYDKDDSVSPNALKYPPKALYEAMGNALAHRDYESYDPTRITVFSDRIEILSPGSLPSGISLDALREGRTYPKWRNQALAWFFPRLQLAQGEGQGIPTILRTMHEIGCQPPRFEADDVCVCCTLPAHPRHATFLSLESNFTPYQTWASQKFGGIDFIGIGGNDLKMDLDAVYVPLRIAHLEFRDDAMGGGEHGDLDLENVFTAAKDGNAVLILGEPGAGKTTVLRKLLYICLKEDEGPGKLGLPPDTVPIFLRLRRFTADVLDDPSPLAAFIERELAEQSDGKLPVDLARTLSKKNGLLLLFDGLDEIADEIHRARVATFLDNEQGEWKKRHIRAVVSCRRAGYDGKTVKFGKQFLHLSVWPLDDGQMTELVHLWFRQAFKSLDRGGPGLADAAGDALLNDLKDACYGATKIKWLVATPLMLTLLCLVVLRGGRIPQRRVEFYAACLEVLLQRWDAGKDNLEPPLLDLTASLAVLRPLAWQLHVERRSDDLTMVEAADLIEGRMPSLPPGRDGFDVVNWLHRRAGVLAEFGENLYGFMYLGFQEYLTACHVALERKALLPVIAEKASDVWWREVILLLAGMADRDLFAELADRLLLTVGQPGCADLLRECLREAPDANLDPFLARLKLGGDAVIQEEVLRLLLGRTDPVLRDAALALVEGGADRRVADMAARFLGNSGNGKIVGKPFDLLVIHVSADAAIAVALTEIGRKNGLTLWENGWLPELSRVRREVATVLVVAGASPPWRDRAVLSGLSMLARGDARLILVRLLGFDESGSDMPEALRGALSITWGETIEADIWAALTTPPPNPPVSHPRQD